MKRRIFNIVMCCFSLLVVGLTAISPMSKIFSRIGSRQFVLADEITQQTVFTSTVINTSTVTYNGWSSGNPTTIKTSILPFNIGFQFSIWYGVDPLWNDSDPHYWFEPYLYSYSYSITSPKKSTCTNSEDIWDVSLGRQYPYYPITQSGYTRFTPGAISSSSGIIRVAVWHYLSGDFDCDPVSVDYWTTYSNNTIQTHWFYYDRNDNYLEISIDTGFYGVGSFSSVSTPTDAFLHLYGVGTEHTVRFIDQHLTDNEYYTLGLSQGKSDGEEIGYTIGYTKGRSDGDTIGYNRGYQDGADAASTYTFTGLIGAVIDVPVRTFTSLFHFEILGVYMDGFFAGLLTLCVIVMIVKLVI